jgi:membrane protein implicated in regulation of membrane protease activity
VIHRLRERIADRFLALAVGATTDNGSRSTVPPGLLTWVAVVTGILFLAAGGVRLWHRGSGKNSTFVDILWHATWAAYTLAKLALALLLIMLAYSYLRKRLEERKQAQS